MLLGFYLYFFLRSELLASILCNFSCLLGTIRNVCVFTLAPKRGNFKAPSEMTDTDRKRSRRLKKRHQHLKSKLDAKKTDEKVKKSTKEGQKLDVVTTTKVVKKAIKIGHVTRVSVWPFTAVLRTNILWFFIHFLHCVTFFGIGSILTI